MCWQTRYKTKLKTAEDNIPVTKIIRVSPNEIQAYYAKFIYSIGVVFYSELDSPYRCGHAWLINKGFHSYKSSCTIKLYKNLDKLYCSLVIENLIGIYLDSYGPVFSGSLGIMSCIIPKGSKYYENEYGEIVSDTIKPIYCYKVK